MHRLVAIGRGEGGFVLITSLMVMMLVVTVGIMATNTSIVEMQVAGIDRVHKTAFLGSDSGIYTTPKIIAPYFKQAPDETPPALIGVGGGSLDKVEANIAAVVLGWVDEADVITDHFTLTVQDALMPDGNLPPGENPSGSSTGVRVNIVNLGNAALAGGGVEFGAGSEGLGGKTQGAPLIQISSIGESGTNTRSDVVAVYRYIEGTQGGL